MKKKDDVLSLKDYKRIRTPFVFFDETGSINDKNNRFFALGMVKCMQPYFLDSKIRLLRQQNNFFDEIKSNQISKKNLPLLRKIVDEVFDTPGIKFSCIIINKDDIDFRENFDNNPYIAYQKFTEQLLLRNIRKNETLIVLADYVSTPNDVTFEVDLKHSLNNHFERLAIAGVHRVESHGLNLIQIADLLVGAVIYEQKVNNKLVKGDKNKIKLYKYVLKKLNWKSFLGKEKDRRFKVSAYK